MSSLNRIKQPLLKQQRSTYDGTDKAHSQTSVLTTGFVKDSSSYFIHRYNSVIDIYNRYHPEKRLSSLDQSKIFYYISTALNNPFYQVLIAIVLLFGIGVNIVLMGAIWFHYFFVRKQTKKYFSNKKIVQNPLQDFMFLPDICQTLQKHSTTLSIDNKDLEGFTFNNSLHQQLRNRFMDQNTKRVTVTVYDQYFYDSYHNFAKEKIRVSIWIVLSSILLIGSIFFYLYIFGLLE